jgi:hypothetical protein
MLCYLYSLVKSYGDGGVCVVGAVILPTHKHLAYDSIIPLNSQRVLVVETWFQESQERLMDPSDHYSIHLAYRGSPS